jgi:hypothetical protein
VFSKDLMTPDLLDILLQEGEGTPLEYKEGLSASFSREVPAKFRRMEREAEKPLKGLER